MSDYHMGHNPPQDGCGRPTVECDDEDCVALEDPETIEDFSGSGALEKSQPVGRVFAWMLKTQRAPQPTIPMMR